MIISGGIPEKIIYVLRSTQRVSRGWDELDNEELAEPVWVRPAFPVDPARPATLDTAKLWAGVRGDAKVDTLETINTPIKEVEIITLEARAEGGRAYKVRLLGLGGDQLYVDLREDVLLDAMLLNGVKKGGILKGPFVWGKRGSQMRLVRVGSALHTALKKADESKAEKIIRPSEYKVGGVYLNRSRDLYVYLGKCDMDWLLRDLAPGRFGAAYTGKLRHHGARNQNIWYQIVRGGNLYEEMSEGCDWQKIWKMVYTAEHFWRWTLQIIKAPTITELVDGVQIDWTALRRAPIESAMRDKLNAQTANGVWRAPRAALNLEEGLLLHNMKIAHVRPAGEPLPVHDEYKALWDAYNKERTDT